MPRDLRRIAGPVRTVPPTEGPDTGSERVEDVTTTVQDRDVEGALQGTVRDENEVGTGLGAVTVLASRRRLVVAGVDQVRLPLVLEDPGDGGRSRDGSSIFWT